MPSNHTVELRTPSGTELDEVWVTFGVTWPQARKRPIREGQGFSIELPAVLDLLQAVVAGDEKAADVRDALLKVPGLLYDAAGCYDHETDQDKLAWCVRDGGCRACEQGRRPFARHLEAMAERWRRWNLPEEYPFIAGNSKGLHTVKCSVVRQHMPDHFTAYEPDDADRLRAFAHSRYAYDLEPTTQEPFSEQVPFLPMTAEQARAWMAENTGPQGGRYYKRCQRCAPTP